MTTKKALDKEFSALKEQIDYISKNTEFNDKKLLNGENKTIAIQTLDNADTTKQININLADSSTSALQIDKLTISGKTTDTTKTETITVTDDEIKAAKTDIDEFNDAKKALANLKAETGAGKGDGSTDDEIKTAVSNFTKSFEKNPKVHE